jgi:hypothetical protein
VDRAFNLVASVNGGTGDYLAIQGNEPPSQSSAIYSDIEVALFRGSRGVTIYTPEGSDIPQADPTGAITADWVTFAVARLQDLNPSYYLKYSYKVMLYDRGAGVTRTLVEIPRQQHSPGKSVVGAPVIAAGKVYWLTTVHNNPETTTLESWDLAQNAAAGSVQAANATGLVSYGTGVALVRSKDSGTTRFLQNGAGAPLTQVQLDATVGGLNFGFDGVSQLSWVGSDRGLASPSALGLALYSASVKGGAKISGKPLYPTPPDLTYNPALGYDSADLAVYPFVAVDVNGSDALLDMRNGRHIALPKGVSLQAVVGDEAIFGTGTTKSGAAGLSRVALTALPPVDC